MTAREEDLIMGDAAAVTMSRKEFLKKMGVGIGALLLAIASKPIPASAATRTMFEDNMSSGAGAYQGTKPPVSNAKMWLNTGTDSNSYGPSGAPVPSGALCYFSAAGNGWVPVAGDVSMGATAPGQKDRLWMNTGTEYDEDTGIHAGALAYYDAAEEKWMPVHASEDEVIAAVARLDEEKAVKDHASSATDYGVGSTSNYGHVKTVNDLDHNEFAAGEALSAYQGYLLKTGGIVCAGSIRTSAPENPQNGDIWISSD